MSDVGKVDGKGAKPPEDPKRKKGPDSEAFREMMKVGKVRETDPDEQSKRRGQSKAEEDLAAEQTAPPSQQSLGSEMPPPPFFSESSSPSEITVGPTEVSNSPPTSEPLTSPPQYDQPPRLSQNDQSTQEAPPAKPSERRRRPSRSKKTTTSTTGADPKAKKKKVTKTGRPIKAQGRTPDGLGKKKGLPPALQQEPASHLPAKEKTQKPEKKVGEIAQQTEGVTAPPPPIYEGKGTAEKIEKKKDATALPSEVEAQSPSVHVLGDAAQKVAQTPSLGAPSFANLPLHIAQVFERMVGVMTVMQHSGIKETTITLNNPTFAKSAFYGTQITITEYSTAPLQFNIELSGSQQALNLMEASANELVAAFEAGKYNFKVQRLDLSQQGSTSRVRQKKLQKVKRKNEGNS